jgi:hypothetical protein
MYVCMYACIDTCMYISFECRCVCVSVPHGAEISAGGQTQIHTYLREKLKQNQFRDLRGHSPDKDAAVRIPVFVAYHYLAVLLALGA